MQNEILQKKTEFGKKISELRSMISKKQNKFKLLVI
jgi:hypothetical protein